MNTRITSRFEQLRRRTEKGFVAFITAGDPSRRNTVDIVRRLEETGADFIELGVPFSDPLADGRINQDAAARALQAGITYPKLLKTVSEIRRRSDIPLILYSYLNPLLARSFDTTARQAAEAGVDGFLVVDLPVDEAAEEAAALKRHGVDHICLVTPTSPPARIRRIVSQATGFVYCVSREGVTGLQKRLAPAALDLIRRTRRWTPLPIAIGFGLSTPEQARAAAGEADAVVVGSAIVDRFAREPRSAAGRARAARWVGRLVRAVKESP